jgi:hypothetical protein
MVLRPSNFEEILKLLAALGAIASFIWGVWVWQDKSDKELQQQKLEARRRSESRRIEATQPFLERQLKLYTEVSQVAALIATSDDSYEKTKATQRFWELYWGELALVENQEVESAMVAMGRSIEGSAEHDERKQLSLQLAHACRKSLDRSWGIHAWSTPDEAAGAAKNP